MTTVSTNKRATCALLGAFPQQKLDEEFMTTSEVVSASSNAKEIPALFKPLKLLGDYDVCAGFDGTPELTKKYLAMTPGQVCEQLNTIITKNLQEQTMNTSHTTDEGGKLKSFNEFPIGRTDLEGVVQKAITPMIMTTEYSGDVTHPTLKGTGVATPNAATTVSMDVAKEQAMKRLATFLSGYQANTQQTVATKEVY